MTRALVLSGGGSVGIAWQTGLAAGLASKGVDLAVADFIVGTSAGSAVGAQLALGTDMAERVERYRATRRESESGAAPTSAAREASLAGAGRAGGTGAAGAAPAPWMQRLMQVMGQPEGNRTPEETRAAIGAFALEAETMPEDRFVAGFSYLAGAEWPERYVCTAVNASTGEFVVWDRMSAAPLDRAVASSCAVPGLFPPITINGARYIDGGMRSGSNADLAKGHDLVLLVSLMSPARGAANPADPRAARMKERMDRERAALEESGSTLHVVGPDEDASRAMGGNLMDGTKAPDAAEAGFRQGEAAAASLAEIWS